MYMIYIACAQSENMFIVLKGFSIKKAALKYIDNYEKQPQFVYSVEELEFEGHSKDLPQGENCIDIQDHLKNRQNKKSQYYFGGDDK